MTGIPSLLAVAEAYGDALCIPQKTVSKRALQDSSRLGELRSGACDIGVRRLERTLQWFSNNWPDVEWPAGVARPAPVSSRSSIATVASEASAA
jgi:hypothetical protein